jgi:hypothetical protein
MLTNEGAAAIPPRVKSYEDIPTTWSIIINPGE